MRAARAIAEAALNALFPRFCVACRREGSLLCRSCDEHWQPSPSHLTDVWTLLQYADPIARQLICAWKYQGDTSAWDILRRRLTPKLSLVALRATLEGIQGIVPVPLDYRRKAERGFDQAEDIARWVSGATNISMQHLLARTVTSGHQAERTDAERLEAMAASPFLCRERGGVTAPCRVLLVDDVWTTGATMQAAARALPEGTVCYYLTLARG